MTAPDTDEHRAHDGGQNHRHDDGGDPAHHRHGHDPTGALRGLIRPHSHDAAVSVDEALSSSDAGMRALAISLAGLGATALVQLAILLVSGSVSLLADTIHNAADALTAVPLAVAFWLGRRPPNRRYTYGYGRIEDLAGVCVVVFIGASAILALVEALTRLVHPATVHNLPWVAAAGVAGVAGNEVVARYRITVGRRIGSAALEADGHHARTDGLSSLGVVAGAIGVLAGWQAADAVFGIIITVTILVVVRTAVRDIYRRLMDAVDPALVAQVESLLAVQPGVEAVEAVRLRWVGHNLHCEADIVAAAQLSLAAAHDVGEHAQHELLHEIHRLASVTVHVNPTEHDGSDAHAVTAHHRHGL